MTDEGHACPYAGPATVAVAADYDQLRARGPAREHVPWVAVHDLYGHVDRWVLLPPRGQRVGDLPAGLRRDGISRWGVGCPKARRQAVPGVDGHFPAMTTSKYPY